MTPAETGNETRRPELGDVGSADTDPRDPGAFEDVVHTGRVVEREVVERRDDTVVDHLTRARRPRRWRRRDCHRRRLGVWRAFVPTPPRLLNAATDASRASFTSGFDASGPVSE